MDDDEDCARSEESQGGERETARGGRRGRTVGLVLAELPTRGRTVLATGCTSPRRMNARCPQASARSRGHGRAVADEASAATDRLARHQLSSAHLGLRPHSLRRECAPGPAQPVLARGCSRDRPAKPVEGSSRPARCAARPVTPLSRARRCGVKGTRAIVRLLVAAGGSLVSSSRRREVPSPGRGGGHVVGVEAGARRWMWCS